MKFIICYGNPVDGFAFVGPFFIHEDAEEYAQTKLEDSWWISELQDPI